MNQGILSGIRVLDFTWVLAGPYGTRVLADFGAEVIKIQSRKTAKGVESNLTGYFNHWNRNKRSVTLDMSHPESREIILRLTRLCDVVVNNFSPRVMSNWGLSYERLKEAKPDLILLSISAMGQEGPWKDFVAYGPTLQALSGLTYLTSFERGSPAGIGYAYADPIIGLYGAFAILAALEYRDRTGKGQHIDLSGYEAICTGMGPTLLDASANRREIAPQGNRSENVPAAPYGCYRCSGSDRWCVLAVFNEEEWQGLCRIMGYPDWTKEERFSTLSNRKDHAEALDQLLGQWTLLQTPEEIVALLQEAGIAAGVVQDAEDLADDPHLAERGFFVRLDHPTLGKTVSTAMPVQFREELKGQWKAAPLLGEDNRYVYRELLGFTEEEFTSYVERGIIA